MSMQGSNLLWKFKSAGMPRAWDCSAACSSVSPFQGAVPTATFTICSHHTTPIATVCLLGSHVNVWQTWGLVGSKFWQPTSGCWLTRLLLLLCFRNTDAWTAAAGNTWSVLACAWLPLWWLEYCGMKCLETPGVHWHAISGHHGGIIQNVVEGSEQDREVCSQPWQLNRLSCLDHDNLSSADCSHQGLSHVHQYNTFWYFAGVKTS